MNTPPTPTPAESYFKYLEPKLALDTDVTLDLVRHGETDWNAQHLFQGQKDIPLNNKGKQQSRRIAKRLESVSYQGIFTSALSRAQQTVEFITSDHHPEVQIDPRWNEISFGDWEGYDYAQIKRDFPHKLQVWQDNSLQQAAPGGESLLQLSRRVQEAIEDLLLLHKTGRFLLVAHGGPLQILLCSLIGLPVTSYWQLRLHNASLSSVSVYPHGAVINLLNDTSHLQNG